MFNSLHISAVIPARNEIQSISTVVKQLRKLQGPTGQAIVDDIVVCDNGSSDGTADQALRAGARVVTETRIGYGAACLRALSALGPTDVIVFIDSDQSVKICELEILLTDIALGSDLAIGVRSPQLREMDSMGTFQRLGNALACSMIDFIWNTKTPDLGPFRAIRRSALDTINMQDRAFGWTVEMQIKAIQYSLKVSHPQVSYLRRRGKSKISGTFTGVLRAGYGIISTILLLAIVPVRSSRKHSNPNLNTTTNTNVNRSQ